jgi:hypothetical protein
MSFVLVSIQQSEGRNGLEIPNSLDTSGGYNTSEHVLARPLR